MRDDLEDELTIAHIIGSKKVIGDIEDIIFSHDKKLFRTKLIRGKVKTKLICNVLPELVCIENKGAENKPAHEYLFRVKGAYFDYVEERYFKPKNLTSHRTFTTQLSSMVPFGKFYGNKDDFDQFLRDEFDQCHEKNKINT